MSDPDDQDGALERLVREAKGTVQTQLELGDRVDSTASQLLRFNALVLGVLVTGMSLGFRSGAAVGIPLWLAGLFLSGFFLLVASTLFAARSYRLTGFQLGIRSEDLLDARASEASEREVLDASLEAYAEGVQVNRRGLHRATRELRSALRSLWMGVALLASATGTLMVLEVLI